jgi:tetratricopeptide (TPR) repeat protein
MSDVQRTQPSWHLRPAASSAILLAVSLLVYAPIFSNGLAWDDRFLILGTDVFRDGSNLPEFFTRAFWDHSYGWKLPYYRPMQPLLILLTSTVSGVHPLGYHLLSVGLHAAIAVLFLQYALRLRISERAAMLATAVVLLHPIHVEAVAFAACAPLLVCGVCLLLILLASSRLPHVSVAKRRRLLAGIALAYVVALLSYDLALLIPVLVFLHDRLRPQRDAIPKPTRMWLGEYAIYLATTLVYAAVRIAVLARAEALRFWEILDPNGMNVLYSGGAAEAWLAPFNILSRAAHLLVAPIDLSPEYYFHALDFSSLHVAALLAIVLVSVWWFQERQTDARVYALALLWMVIGTLPALPSSGTFADRVFFFSSLGYALWLGISVDCLWSMAGRRSRLAAAGVAAATIAGLLALAVGTFQQTRVWQSGVTLWEEAVRTSPLKPRAHRNLAAALANAGRLDQASASVERALELSPNNREARQLRQQIDEALGGPPPAGRPDPEAGIQ